MAGLKKLMSKKLGEMGFNTGGGAINWFPGHMAAAKRAIRDRLKVSDLVIEVRDSRIPLSSSNLELQPLLANKRRILALNKRDLADPNMMKEWIHHFESRKQDCVSINAHSRISVTKLLELVESKLKEAILKEPTLIVMVVGVPNVGKSVLINAIHQIASSRFPVQGKNKRARVGPLPGVTQDIAGFKIAHHPSIYVLDSPGVLFPSCADIETGLKLALAGSVKDSVVGEERIAQYLLAVLNSKGTPLQWRSEGIQYKVEENPEFKIKDPLPRTKQRPNKSNINDIQNYVSDVKGALYVTLSEFKGNVDDESDLGELIEQQFEALEEAFKVADKASEARLIVSKKLLALFRAGKFGPFILDDVPETDSTQRS